MPEMNLDAEGYLIGIDGKRTEIDGEPVKVSGAFSQAQLDNTIKERLARAKESQKSWEEAAKKMPEMQAELDKAREAVKALEAEAAQAKTEAEKRVAAQIAKAQKDAAEASAALEAERAGRMRDQVATAILGAAGNRFVKAGDDIVPKLLAAHKREPVMGEDGKPKQGEFSDTFKLRYEREGKAVEESLPLDKALNVLAEQYPHYVVAANRGGAGGGSYSNTGNLKRSAMDTKAKTEFVSKHGLEAFQSLPA